MEALSIVIQGLINSSNILEPNARDLVQSSPPLGDENMNVGELLVEILSS